MLICHSCLSLTPLSIQWKQNHSLVLSWVCSELLQDSKILVWVFLAILHSPLAVMDDDQGLREETVMFPWYLPSSCPLDISQLSLLLFSARMYVPLSPLSLMFSFSSFYYGYSLARVWKHQPEILKAVHETVAFFLPLYVSVSNPLQSYK